MPSKITATGLVATTPRHLITTDGVKITSFRLADNSPRYDYTKKAWVEDSTNWFTITAYGDLAVNVAGSVNKGERIVVSGDLRVRDWDNGERAGTSVEIQAETIGHDLAWGTGVFSRTILSGEPRPAPADADDKDVFEIG
jgi:single-strand DNA-binding protein